MLYYPLEAFPNPNDSLRAVSDIFYPTVDEEPSLESHVPQNVDQSLHFIPSTLVFVIVLDAGPSYPGKP